MFSWIKPPRPVHPADIHEIAGRLDVDGTEIEPVAADEIEALGRSLAASGCDAIAICLLHAYANPAHERQVRDGLMKAMPGAQISIFARRPSMRCR